jgi:hypothetical protein
VFLAAAGLWAAWGAGPALADTGALCWDETGEARIWPAITFQRAADLDDYRRTLAQNRDQVRQTLEEEYLRLLRELALAGAKPEELAEPVLGAILAFDELHDRHRERAADGVPAFLEVGLRTALNQLYRSNRIADERRRLRFAGPDLAEQVSSARREIRTTPETAAEELGTLQEAAAQVDLIAFGTFSSDGGRLYVTLTLENPRTGSLCDFGVTAWPLTRTDPFTLVRSDPPRAYGL